MRLWPLITDLIARLIARLIAVNGKIAIAPRHAAPHRTAPARHVRPRTRTARPAGRAAPRLASPRLGHGHGHGPARRGAARRGERARARVVHRPPLTGFTSGVHEVHLLSRLRSSIPGTELSIDSLALIVGFKFF